MNDDKDNRNRDDDHELTFESGYGAQDKVLQEDETLEDVAGVSEEDIRKDIRTETSEDSEADSGEKQED